MLGIICLIYLIFHISSVWTYFVSNERSISTTTMIRKVITIPNAMDKWIKTQIKSGYYRNDSEYFRDLIRLKKAGGRRQEAAMYPHKSI